MFIVTGRRNLALKKQVFKYDENPIFIEVCVDERSDDWQCRMWLARENKYAPKSLRTCSETSVVERGKLATLQISANLRNSPVALC